ncbi:hypothetical protein ABBQ38_012327 [Trebouxia sp. C0009 RCD-2024]
MAFQSYAMKFLVLALVLLCALQAVQTTTAASESGTDGVTASGMSHRRNLKDNVIECSSGERATAAAECDINVTDGTNYFICLSGMSAGGCRAQAQGTFGSDCTRSCVIM